MSAKPGACSARNEGDVQTGVKPYPVSYRAIIPRAEECENLWVPVALSATHIAYGSIRMEPVFMILGQSAATAASMAIDDRVPAQQVDYAKLRAQLEKDGQVLAWKAAPGAAKPAPPQKHEGLVLDDADAKMTGAWVVSTASGNHHAGTGYVHDANAHKGEMSARWTPEIAEAGDYEIALLFAPNPNRATNAPVSIEIAGQPAQTVSVNQRETSGVKPLGKFVLSKGQGITITLSNRDTDGFVIADGVVLRRVKP